MTLADDRWVRIMGEYCAPPVWGLSGVPAEMEDLPISSGLRESLRQWGKCYDHYSPTPGDDHPAQFDVVKFSWLGLQFAKFVKQELPDWTIIYHDEAKALQSDWKTSDQLEKRRHTFEYEVTKHMS